MRLVDWARSVGRTPVVPLLGYPGLYLTDVSAEEALTVPDTLTRTVSATVERFGPDAVFTIMDLTVEAEALGLPVVMSDREPPSITEHPVADVRDINGLNKPDPAKDGRMPVFLEAVGALKECLSIPLGTYVIGPFTLAGELAGAESLASATILDAGFVEKLLSFSTSVVNEYARALAVRGADIIAILEPTSVILSPAFFERFSLPWVSSVASTIRECGAFPVLHICGDTTHLIGGMLKTGVDGFSLDSPVDIPLQAGSAPDDYVFIGNIDPVEVMLQGEASTVEGEALKLLSSMRGQDNFILSSGCDLPLDTPHENIDALIQTASSSRQQQGISQEG
jgi:uroporphyrinogen decarboxylase